MLCRARSSATGEDSQRLQQLQPRSSGAEAARVLPPRRKVDDLSELELLGLYDQVTFARLIEKGFAFQHDVKSEVESLSRNGALKTLRETTASIGEDQVLHLALSEDGSCAALVTKDATIKIWRKEDLKEGWTPSVDIKLPLLNLDGSIGETVAKFFTAQNGQPELALIHPQADDVMVTRIEATTGIASSAALLQASDRESLRCFKVAEDARRALAVFDDKTFSVVKLDEKELSIGMTGHFSYPCVFDNFVEQHVKQACIHVSDDCRFLTTGWDLTKERLITFSLDIDDAKMHDEYVQKCGGLTLSNIGFVWWLNAERSRAIVCRRRAGPLHFLVYETTGLSGTVLREIQDAAVERSRHCSSSMFEWMIEFDPDKPSDLRFFSIRMLLSLQEYPPDYALLSLLDVALDDDIIRWFISKFGPSVVNSPNAEEKSLLHYVFMHQKLDLAEMIFKVAAENDIPVQLCWSDGDILGWSIEKGSYRLLVFLLRRIRGKCATVEDTANVLCVHFDTLLAKFPHLVDDYLTNDKLCFEYGRFSVPMHVLAASGDKPIAMITDCMNTWTAASGEEAKRFWTQSKKPLERKLNDTSQLQVTAVSKFVCIDDVACDKEGDLLHKLVCSKLPMEAFNSQFISTMVQWKWHTVLKIKAFISCVLHLLATFSFTIFASTYGLDYENSFYVDWQYVPPNNSSAAGSEPAPEFQGGHWELVYYSQDDRDRYIWETETDETDLKTARWSLGVAYTLLWLLTFFGIIRISRLLSALSKLSMLVMLVGVVFSDKNTGSMVFLTSVYCITLWISILFYLQPFGTLGPLVSMIRYVIWDTMPFALLIALAIAGFGMAFYVLFNVVFDGKSHGMFNTQARAFESMFYAIFGEFDREVMLQTSEMHPFLAIWISILFVAFLFLGSIVLLSLLIAILGDTYDRVKMTERAELIKCRAKVIGKRPHGVCTWLRNKVTNCLCCRKQSKFVAGDRRFRHASGVFVYPRGKCFHFLVPAEPIVRGSNDTWPGKILALVRMIKARINENESKSAEERKDLNDSVSQLQQKVEEMENRLENRMARMENSLALILHKLEGVTSSRT